MLVRMAQAADRRRRREWVMLAQVVAAGVAAGFSGNWKGIHALARALDVPVSGAHSIETEPGGIGDVVTRLYRDRGVSYGGGPNRRRASGRA